MTERRITPGDRFRRENPDGKNTGMTARIASTVWERWQVGGGNEIQWRTADGRCRVTMASTMSRWFASLDGKPLKSPTGKVRAFIYRATAMEAVLKARNES